MPEKGLIVSVRVKSEFLEKLLTEVKALHRSTVELERLITFELENNLKPVLELNPEEVEQ